MLLELTTLIVAGALILWFYGRWKHAYWQRMGVHSPPTKAFLGHINHRFSSTRHVWEWRNQACYKDGGKVVSGLYNFLTPQLLVSDPDLLKAILVKDFDHFAERRTISFTGPDDRLLTDMLSNSTGERWRKLRSAVTPAFTSGRLKTMFALITQKAKILTQVSRTLAQKDEPVEVKKLMGRYSMDTTASCGFGIETNSLMDDEDEFSKRAAIIFNPTMKRILQLMAFYVAPRLCRALGMKAVSPHMQYYGDVVAEVLRHREETGIVRGDFIDLMIDARKIPDDNVRAGKKHVLEDITIVAQSAEFLLAGYGNMENTLAFCFYHLARDQKLQEQAREEISKLQKEYGNELSYEAIMDAKFLDACITETLRLYPGETASNRLCVKDYRLGDTGITVPKGMVVEIPIWSFHHDPDYWSEPEEFQPNRFLDGNKTNINPFMYQPFGTGPRNCIGQRFSMLVMKTALAFFLQGVHMKVAPSQSHPIELACGPLILRPKNGIRLMFDTINDSEN